MPFEPVDEYARRVCGRVMPDRRLPSQLRSTATARLPGTLIPRPTEGRRHLLVFSFLPLSFQFMLQCGRLS